MAWLRTELVRQKNAKSTSFPPVFLISRPSSIVPLCHPDLICLKVGKKKQIAVHCIRMNSFSSLIHLQRGKQMKQKWIASHAHTFRTSKGSKIKDWWYSEIYSYVKGPESPGHFLLGKLKYRKSPGKKKSFPEFFPLFFFCLYSTFN